MAEPPAARGVGFCVGLPEGVAREGGGVSMLLLLIILPTKPSRNSLAAAERCRKGAKL